MKKFAIVFFVACLGVSGRSDTVRMATEDFVRRTKSEAMEYTTAISNELEVAMQSVNANGVEVPESAARRGVTFIDADGVDQNASVSIGRGAISGIRPEEIESAPSNTIIRSGTVAIGVGAVATNAANYVVEGGPYRQQATAIGWNAHAIGINSVAIGSGAIHTNEVLTGGDAPWASGQQSIAIGYGARALSSKSIQIGQGINTTENSIQFGNVMLAKNGKLNFSASDLGAAATNAVTEMMGNKVAALTQTFPTPTNDLAGITMTSYSASDDGEHIFTILVHTNDAVESATMRVGSGTSLDIYKSQTVDRLLAGKADKEHMHTSDDISDISQYVSSKILEHLNYTITNIVKYTQTTNDIFQMKWNNDAILRPKSSPEYTNGTIWMSDDENVSLFFTAGVSNYWTLVIGDVTMTKSSGQTSTNITFSDGSNTYNVIRKYMETVPIEYRKIPDMISDSYGAAVDNAKADATTKANSAYTLSKIYTDGQYSIAMGIVQDLGQHIITNDIPAVVEDILSPKSLDVEVSTDTPEISIKASNYTINSIRFLLGSGAATNQNADISLLPSGTARNYQIYIGEILPEMVKQSVMMDFSYLRNDGFKIYATPSMGPTPDHQNAYGWSIGTNDIPCIITVKEPVPKTLIVKKESFSAQ